MWQTRFRLVCHFVCWAIFRLRLSKNACRGEHCSPVPVCLVRKLSRKMRCCSKLTGDRWSPPCKRNKAGTGHLLTASRKYVIIIMAISHFKLKYGKLLGAYMERNNRKRGFTLVELIVVLVILAVLAALLVPSLTGYIDKAKKQAVITEARDVWTASQAALSECYALYPESFTAKINSTSTQINCRFSVYINNKWVSGVGKISNAALNAVQRNPKDPTEAGTASRKVSAMVLAYLDSANKNNARYTFYDGKPITKDTKPSTYFVDGKPKSTDIIIQLFHTVDGKVIALNYGKDGYMVTIVPGQEIICEYDGKCLNFKG